MCFAEREDIKRTDLPASDTEICHDEKNGICSTSSKDKSKGWRAKLNFLLRDRVHAVHTTRRKSPKQ